MWVICPQVMQCESTTAVRCRDICHLKTNSMCKDPFTQSLSFLCPYCDLSLDSTFKMSIKCCNNLDCNASWPVSNSVQNTFFNKLQQNTLYITCTLLIISITLPLCLIFQLKDNINTWCCPLSLASLHNRLNNTYIFHLAFPLTCFPLHHKHISVYVITHFNYIYCYV